VPVNHSAGPFPDGCVPFRLISIPSVLRCWLPAHDVERRRHISHYNRHRLVSRSHECSEVIIAWHRGNATSKRLDELPGVGLALATALVPDLNPIEMPFSKLKASPAQGGGTHNSSPAPTR
jgi:hypothetical protein